MCNCSKGEFVPNPIKPLLSPDIQVVVVVPSLPAITNCLLPVLLTGSTLPIITFPDPVVIPDVLSLAPAL